MEKKYIDMLEKMGKMTHQLNITYSVATKKFYLNTDLMEIKGKKIVSITKHEETPEQAIESAFNQMKDAEGIYYLNKPSRREKEFVWDGKQFVATVNRIVPKYVIINEEAI